MIGLSDILSAMQNGVSAINNLANTVASVFPQTVIVSTSPPVGGSLVYNSSLAAAFMSVTTSSGATYRIPLY